MLILFSSAYRDGQQDNIPTVYKTSTSPLYGLYDVWWVLRGGDLEHDLITVHIAIKKLNIIDRI